MSYILEALKKAQAERQLGSAPTIHALPLHGAAETSPAPRRRAIWAGAALAVVALAAVGIWRADLFGAKSAAPLDARALVAAPGQDGGAATEATGVAPASPPAAQGGAVGAPAGQGVAVGVSAPAGQGVAVSALTGQGVAVGAAVQGGQSGAPGVSNTARDAGARAAGGGSVRMPSGGVSAATSEPAVAQSPTRSPTMTPGGLAQSAVVAASPAASAATRSVRGGEAALAPARSSGAATAAGVAATAAPSASGAVPAVVANVRAGAAAHPQRGEASVGAAPGATQASADVPYARELPDAIQRQLPTLSFGGYIYSSNPADRLVLVDKVLRHEGEEVAPGLVLEKLLPKAAVVNFKGVRYRVAY